MVTFNDLNCLYCDSIGSVYINEKIDDDWSLATIKLVEFEPFYLAKNDEKLFIESAFNNSKG